MYESKRIKDKFYNKGFIEAIRSYEVKQKDFISLLESRATELSDRLEVDNTDSFVKKIMSLYFDIKDPNTTIEFLDGCIGGRIINLKDLASQTEGNINNHINTFFMNTFPLVSKSLMKLKADKTRGSTGPAEILLLLGNPASKLAKGDIKIDGLSYEIKAANKSDKNKKSKSGARLNCSNMPKNREFFKTVDIIFKTHFNDLNDKHFNLTIEGIESFNRYIKKNNLSKDMIVSFLVKVLGKLYESLDISDKLIERAVNDDLTLDTAYEGKFFRGLFILNYLDYKETDKFDRLMIVNQTTMNYVIIESVEHLVELLENKKITILGSISRDDTQNVPAMKFYID